MGLKDEQIKEIEKRNKPADHITIYAPTGGIVIEKLKQEGDRVKLGERIYTIADLDRVWVHLDAYEADLIWLRYGQEAVVTTKAYPGQEFVGRIDFIQPVLNDATRTVKVRVNVPNPDRKLKPEMFVHGVVRSRVATAGRVLDPDLAGKWIGPMHPSVIKDKPGKCDICGMDLVTPESLGYITADTDEKDRPLVIPYLAALVTGTRAIVYVELPSLPPGVESAFRAISTALEKGKIDAVHEAFTSFNDALDQPYDQPSTDYHKQLWSGLADQLAEDALAGRRAQSVKDARQAFQRLETTMEKVRGQFAPPDFPTFQGREIVLGPRAGDYYLVRHGLNKGEMVVVQGNFMIDSEIQIQAKPSMMTPEGGGGGGHDHGGHGGGKQPSGTDQSAKKMALPSEFREQIHRLESAYDDVAQAVENAALEKIKAAFDRFGTALDQVDGQLLTGHAGMLWDEFEMLLGNDVFEGREAQQRQDADRAFLLLKRHMRRLRDKLGTTHQEHGGNSAETQHKH